jgi:hypothetical protein
MKDTQPILIISTGRTGTIFFSRLFADLYPTLAASYHERGNSRPMQILTNLHFSHLFPKSGLIAAWKLFKSGEIEACEKPFHIDANCFLYGLAPLAPELYPNLKVLHIVRDPRSYVTSHLNFSRQKGTSFIANYFVPFWQPNPFLVGGLPLSRSFGFTRFEKYCWIWNFKNRVMDGLENSSTPYLLFMVGEYLNIVLMCAMMSILFLGGWLPPIDIWPINAIPGVLWLILKVWFFFFLFAMAKAIVPRYRYDQLMRLGWKVFLPISLLWVVLTAGYLLTMGKVPG